MPTKPTRQVELSINIQKLLETKEALEDILEQYHEGKVSLLVGTDKGRWIVLDPDHWETIPDEWTSWAILPSPFNKDKPTKYRLAEFPKDYGLSALFFDDRSLFNFTDRTIVYPDNIDNNFVKRTLQGYIPGKRHPFIDEETVSWTFCIIEVEDE